MKVKFGSMTHYAGGETTLDVFVNFNDEDGKIFSEGRTKLEKRRKEIVNEIVKKLITNRLD